ISLVVIPLAVYALSGSIGLLAGSLGARLLIGSVVAGAGGHLADRYDRKSIILASYLLRAAVIGSLIVLPSSGWLFAAVGIVGGAVGPLDNPSTEAWLRSRMPHNLQGIATMRQIARACSGLVGPALGGLVLALSTTKVALAVDAATFVVALLLIASLSAPRSPVVVLDAVDDAAAPVSGLRQIGGYTRRDPVLRVVFTALFLSDLAVAVCLVAAVAYLSDLRGAPTGAYGWALAAYSAGALAGLPLAGSGTWRIALAPLLRRAAVAYGVICLAGVAVEQWWLLALSWLVWGIAFGPESIVTDTRIAATTPPALLGRIYAARSAVGMWAMASGYAVAGALGSSVGPRTLIVGAGVLLLVVSPAAISAATVSAR
ncbi:MAG: hypothetical protein QOG49_1587, partial [Frankiaceae bacterium]|nr:hypothetical protein [Frankiaceae bacterium]